MTSLEFIETIKVVQGNMLLKKLHINRLHESLKLIDIHFSKEQIEAQLFHLFKIQLDKTTINSFVFRIEIHKKPLTENELDWHISTRFLENEKFILNDKGLKITVYKNQKKEINKYANTKNTNRTIYTNALQFAHENGWEDAIILNENNFVADTSIYNIFIIKNNIIYTPPLSDAPVAGTMRSFLLNHLPNLKIIEKSISFQDLQDADELFLTNAIRGIRWVEYFNQKKYRNKHTQKLFEVFNEQIKI